MNGFLPIQEPRFRAAADEWILSSLSGGLVISDAVASGLTLSAGAVYVLGDGEPAVESSEDFARGHNGFGAEEALVRFISELPVANLLLVENDLALRTDPWLFGNAAFFGDLVVHWVDLPGSVVLAPELLRRGASGYPLNAFLLRADSRTLGLAYGRGMTADSVDPIANEVCGVIVAAYDAEAYLLWLADDPMASGE